MATTIVALHLKGNIATIAHVGDSRVYRFTPDGQVFRETNDHSVVEEEVRAGRITPEQALHHPSRNIISRALGAEEDVEIEVKTIMVEPNTTFLLCSDGITRHIPDDELRSVFSTGAEPRLICEQLKELCYSRGAEDNLTAVIVRTFAEGAEELEDFDSTVPVIDEETIATARTAYAVSTAGPTDSQRAEPTVEDTISQIDIDEMESLELPPAEESSEVADSAESQTPSEEPAGQIIVGEEPQFVEPLVESSSDEQILSAETEDNALGKRSNIGSNPPLGNVASRQTQTRDNEFSMFGSSAPDIWEETGTSKSGVGRILLSLGLLALGGALAVGASYYLGFTGPQQVVEPPQVETMKTQNIPLTEFEESRRTVDKDPAAYLQKAPTSNDAVDFYLRGRALLLTGKTAEARVQFEQARDRLNMVDTAEQTTLKNEIALGLAVVENDPAFASFKRAVEFGSTTANSNSATNPPIR